MATINLTGTTVTAGVPSPAPQVWKNYGKCYVAKVVVDLTAGALTGADIYQVFSIPANTQIMCVRSRVKTAAVGTTCALDIGIGGSNGWNNDIDGKTEADTVSACGTDAESVSPAACASGLQGTFYATADTIDVTVQTATAITAGPKLELYIVCVDFN